MLSGGSCIKLISIILGYDFIVWLYLLRSWSSAVFSICEKFSDWNLRWLFLNYFFAYWPSIHQKTKLFILLCYGQTLKLHILFTASVSNYFSHFSLCELICETFRIWEDWAQLNACLSIRCQVDACGLCISNFSKDTLGCAAALLENWKHCINSDQS